MEYYQGRNWIDRQLQRAAPAVTNVGIPLAILVIDWLLRLTAQVGITDAPADLSLLAIPCLVSILAQDARDYFMITDPGAKEALSRQLVVDVFYIILAVGIWVATLMLVSAHHPLWTRFGLGDSMRVFIAAVLGATALGYAASLLPGR